MLSFISLIVVLVGCANWLTIGLLQFDFVAGLFGSQSNIFSRIIYVVVGVAAVIMVVNLIKNKGKLVFKNKSKQTKNIKEQLPQEKLRNQPIYAENGEDNAKNNYMYDNNNQVKHNTEAGNEYYKRDENTVNNSNSYYEAGRDNFREQGYFESNNQHSQHNNNN